MGRLHAAATQLDLQPPPRARLTGFANRLEPSVGYHDALMAKVLLLDDGATRLLWISCDLIGFSVADAAELRRLVAETLKMPASNVIVSCTHTHSGPSSMPFRGALDEVDRDWLNRTFRRIADAAGTLPTQCRSARLAHATTTVAGLGYNRQDNVSPIDERLLVAQLIDERDEVIATLLNYATHPVVLGEHNLSYSGDYPGFAIRLLEQSIGGVALFILGSAGDVDPAVYRDHGRHAGTFDTAEQMGRELASAAVCALRSATPLSNVNLSIAEHEIRIPLDPPPSTDQLENFKSDRLAGRKQDPWTVFELAWAEELQHTLQLGTVPRELPVSIVAINMGPLRAVTFPLETYSQIGLDIRQQLAPTEVIIAGYTNGLIGYATTDRAKHQGGYGPSASHRFFPHLLTPIGFGAADALASAACQLLHTARDALSA
jgi:hypothetical protein